MHSCVDRTVFHFISPPAFDIAPVLQRPFASHSLPLPHLRKRARALRMWTHVCVYVCVCASMCSETKSTPLNVGLVSASDGIKSFLVKWKFFTFWPTQRFVSKMFFCMMRSSHILCISKSVVKYDFMPVQVAALARRRLVFHGLTVARTHTHTEKWIVRENQNWRLFASIQWRSSKSCSKSATEMWKGGRTSDEQQFHVPCYWHGESAGFANSHLMSFSFIVQCSIDLQSFCWQCEWCEVLQAQNSRHQIKQ